MDQPSIRRKVHVEQDRISPQLVLIPGMALANAAFAMWLQNRGPPWPRYLETFAIGALFGEAAWLATWGTFGPGRWWLGTLRMVVWSWLLYGALVIVSPARSDLRSLNFPDRWEYMLALFVPVYVLCLQAPLLFLKGALRLETLHDGQLIEPRRNLRQFGILDVMIVTTIVAVSVAATKLAFVVCALSAVPAQIVILPSIAAGLLMRNAVKGTVAFVSYLVLFSLLLVGIFAPAGDFGALAVGQLSMMLGIVATMHGSVMIARACGYHLRRAPERSIQ